MAELPGTWEDYRERTGAYDELPVPWFVEELVQWREENLDALRHLRAHTRADGWRRLGERLVITDFKVSPAGALVDVGRADPDEWEQLGHPAKLAWWEPLRWWRAGRRYLW